VNLGGMFWTITNGKYKIVSENVFNNFQDIVVTPSTTTSMANFAVENILIKEEPIAISHNWKFYIFIAKSSFIDLCDSFDKDGPSPLEVGHVSVNSQTNKEQPLQMEVLLLNL